MAPRRSDRIARRSIRSVPAFLRLPQEIRDYIYEMLVTTAWTYDYIEGQCVSYMHRPVFDQSPAILLVNKQVSAEARRIFYTKNEFIVVKLLGSRAQAMVEFIESKHLPHFAIIYDPDLVDPVLTVTIRSLIREEDDDLDDEEFTLITTTEAIHNLIDRLWSYIMEGEPHFDETLHLGLHFRNKNPSRRSYLEEHILKRWDQIQGFKKVSLTGDFDESLARHLEEYMMMGPHPSDIDRYLQLYQWLAEDHQKRKLYRQAGWFYGHLYSYWQYHDYSATHLNTGRPRDLFKFRHDFERNLGAAQPILMKTMLEKMKISLHLSNYEHAMAEVCDALDWTRYESYFDWVDERGPRLVEAQILLCKCVAGIGRHDKTDRVSKDLEATTKAFVEGNRQSPKGLHDKLCWAIDNYFIDLDSSLRYTHKQWLNSRNHTDKEVSREGWLTFWEWINLPVIARKKIT